MRWLCVYVFRRVYAFLYGIEHIYIILSRENAFLCHCSSSSSVVLCTKKCGGLYLLSIVSRSISNPYGYIAHHTFLIYLLLSLCIIFLFLLYHHSKSVIVLSIIIILFFSTHTNIFFFRPTSS